MKTFFDADVRQELLIRLERLEPGMPALWGKMNAAQMLAHCANSFLAPTGELAVTPAPFLFRLLGRMMKKSWLGEKPLNKNSPTAPEFLIKENKDFESEKQRFLVNFQKAASKSAVRTDQHAFFGPFTPDDWGLLLYKHTDHHFQQFGI